MASERWNRWVTAARSIAVEDEIARRGIKLRGKIDRCGPCPKCGGEDRFSVNTSKQVFNCRGCNEGGDIIALVEFLDGVDFNRACELLTGEPAPSQKRVAGTKKIVAAEYPYPAADGAIAFVVERIEYQKADGSFVMKDGKKRKEFRQKRPDPDNPGKWIWNVNGAPIVPYQLPRVLKAIADRQCIAITEGERCANLLWEIDIPATTNAGGSCKWKPELNSFFVGADLVLIPDNDEAGYKHVQHVGAALNGIASRIRVLVLPNVPLKGDVADWMANGGTREQLQELINQAPDWRPSIETGEKKAQAEAGEQEILDGLARLNRFDYEHRRKEAAEELGMRAPQLDAEVAERRERQQAETGPPPLFGHWIVEPWPESVDTDALLLSLTRRLHRHVVFSNEAGIVVALWILFAWVHDVAVHSPNLLVTSVERDSGKTTLLNLIHFLAPRGLLCVEISEAALFRGIELWQPTLIVDEADTILVENESLRAVINSGWTRGLSIPRCIGDEKVPHAFPTFCPKAIGMKGRKLPDTTLSRCIIIELKRKRANEKVEHFRCIDDPGLEELRRQAMRWANDNAAVLKDKEPEMPPGFDNRLGDNFRLLFAIADLAGGEWPEKAREAARVLSGAADTASQKARLLADIKKIRGAKEGDAISSAALVEELVVNEDSEWAEMGKSRKPISQNQLAGMLKEFRIAPQQVRIGGKQCRGYEWAWFEDAWSRYV
jgi:putative DNA primase/helicase